jgi:hypothetical protein
MARFATTGRTAPFTVQFAAAPPPGTLAQPSTGDSLATGEGSGTGPTAAASEQAATSAEKRYYVAAAALILIGELIAIGLRRHYHPDITKVPQLAAGLSPFALLYVFAQSIERVLEPVSPLLGGILSSGRPQQGGLVAERDKTWAEAVGENGTVTAEAAAEAQRQVDQFRANSAALSFGLAVFLATLVSGYFGVLFLRMLGLTTGAPWIDLLITGLAIGGGTKPLHDLISNIQGSKDDKKDPPTNT